MKNFIMIISLLFSTTCSQVFADRSLVEGHYDCQWINSDSGATIKGEMTIKKHGKTYSMKSHYDDNSSYIGTGIYSQNKRNFSMVYYNPKQSDEIGVTTVEIQENTLNTTWLWAYVNKQSIEHTTCIKRNTKKPT